MSKKKPAEDSDVSKHFSKSEIFLGRLDSRWALSSLMFRTFDHQYAQEGVNASRAKRLLVVHQFLEKYKERVTNGETIAILKALRFCGKEMMPMPEWLYEAFCGQMNRFMNHKHPDPAYQLDDCFKEPKAKATTKDKRRTAARDNLQAFDFWWAVHHEVLTNLDVLSLNQVIDVCLQRGSWGFAKTKAKQLVKEIDTEHSALIPNHETLSQILTKRRHK